MIPYLSSLIILSFLMGRKWCATARVQWMKPAQMTIEITKNFIKPIDFTVLECYTILKSRKEVALMFNNKSYSYFFIKGCSSFVIPMA